MVIVLQPIYKPVCVHALDNSLMLCAAFFGDV